MFKILVSYKDKTFDEFDSVISIEVAMGPSHRKLTDKEILGLNFGSNKDIYVFTSESKNHLIAANTMKCLTVSEVK